VEKFIFLNRPPVGETQNTVCQQAKKKSINHRITGPTVLSSEPDTIKSTNQIRDWQ
jgi:hypothetical protein